MAFISNKNVPEIGKNVILNRDIVFPHGIFEKGTEMMIVGESSRGFDLIDPISGQRISECSSSNFKVARK